MSIYSVSTSLAGPPTLRYGFWYSYGSTQTRGHMLTVTNFWASYLALALGLLVGWAVARLWRIGCAVLFYFSYTAKPSWEESQNNVFIVNSKSALDGCIDSYIILKGRAKAYRRHGGGYHNALRGNKSPRYRRAKYVVIIAMLVGFITIGLNLAVPLLIALVPLTKLGIAVPRDCGNITLSIPNNASASDPGMLELIAETEIRQKRWANAAFGTIDGTINNQPDDSGSFLPGAGRTALPEPEISMNYSCPTAVSACSTEHPFTFSSQYTLLAQHFGLNIGIPFSLRVIDSCYRPSGTAVPINPADLNGTSDTPYDPAHPMYGLYYGPIEWPNGTGQNATRILNPALLDSPSYTIDAIYSKAGDPYGWFPNATLMQGGDTTLLLYYLGSVRMINQASDPLFATEIVDHYQGTAVYYHESASVPIICDTKYVFCDGNSSSNDCSGPGGIIVLLSWLKDRQSTTWADLRSLLATLLDSPPMYMLAFGSTAILASQSLDSFQFAPGNATALRELSRLSTAGMVTVASYAQLSVAGYLKTTDMVATLAPESDPDSLCNNVITELSTVTTIPVIPYLLFVLFSFLIVVVSYSSAFSLLKRIFFSSFDRLFNIWALHLPGQLHREVTEKLRGRNFKFVSLVDSWPATSYQSGPTVVAREGAERFSSGNTGLLENMEEDTEEYPLDTHPLE